jgi:hypothetical protein
VRRRLTGRSIFGLVISTLGILFFPYSKSTRLIGVALACFLTSYDDAGYGMLLVDDKCRAKGASVFVRWMNN